MSSEVVNGHDYKRWQELCLKDFGDFADKIEYVNQEEYGDGQLEGVWYYGEEDHLKTGKRWVIYHGSFGNDNSPGASHYTYAEVFYDEQEWQDEMNDWLSQPEFFEEEECTEEEDPRLYGYPDEEPELGGEA